MLIVDTGVLLAAADNADPDHLACAELLAAEVGPLVASPLVIAEAAGVQRGASGAGSPFDWELAQLYQSGRLPTTELFENGVAISNPFG